MRFQRPVTTGRTGIEVIDARHQYITARRDGFGPAAGGAGIGDGRGRERHRLGRSVELTDRQGHRPDHSRACQGGCGDQPASHRFQELIGELELRFGLLLLELTDLF